MRRRNLRRFIGIAGAMAVGYALAFRPWMLRWGSTAEERARPLPGDDVEPDATYVTTRAATIRAPTGSIWPWLVQMGQDRAGFYTHNWVERLLQSGIPDTSVIRPEWQHLEAGDLMRTNRDIGGKPMGWPVAAVDPGRSLVVTSRSMPAGSYAFVIDPIDSETSRLIVRDRALWKWWEWPFAVLIYEPLHGYMETGLIGGVRRRAEAAVEDQNDRRASGSRVDSGTGDEDRGAGPAVAPSLTPTHDWRGFDAVVQAADAAFAAEAAKQPVFRPSSLSRENGQ